MVAVPLAQPETRSVAQIATQAASRSLLTLAPHLARLVPAASPASWERSRVKWTNLGRRPLPHPTSCGLLRQRDKHQPPGAACLIDRRWPAGPSSTRSPLQEGTGRRRRYIQPPAIALVGCAAPVMRPGRPVGHVALVDLRQRSRRPSPRFQDVAGFRALGCRDLATTLVAKAPSIGPTPDTRFAPQPSGACANRSPIRWPLAFVAPRSPCRRCVQGGVAKRDFANHDVQRRAHGVPGPLPGPRVAHVDPRPATEMAGGFCVPPARAWSFSSRAPADASCATRRGTGHLVVRS